MNRSKSHPPRHSQLVRSLVAGIVLLLATVLPCSPSGVHAQPDRDVLHEYELKAIYLYNFLQFVQWPKELCPADGGITGEIIVIGDSPINRSLETLRRELKKTRNLDLSIRFYKDFQAGIDFGQCSLIFIARGEIRNIDKILDHTRGKPVLTVGDTEECLDQGCMIALLSRMNKVRWAVNRNSTEQAGLRMNARLLEMAVKVVD